MKRIRMVTACAVLLSCAAFGEGYDDNGDGKPDKWTESVEGGMTKISVDRDFDGTPDYEVILDEDANVREERQDYNGDGRMDDFYFYVNSVLVRRELDSNYDGKVDIWVYLSEGVYVQKYEKDTDFDGKVDVVKDYDKK